jgi:hypothetical protein
MQLNLNIQMTRKKTEKNQKKEDETNRQTNIKNDDE